MVVDSQCDFDAVEGFVVNRSIRLLCQRVTHLTTRSVCLGRALMDACAQRGNGDAGRQTYADGEIIYHRGEHNDCCYFVHKGVVRLEAGDGSVERKVGRWGVIPSEGCCRRRRWRRVFRDACRPVAV